MDAEYLNKTVNSALTEALTSMATAMPEDKIEYIGRYLKTAVIRQKLAITKKAEEEQAEKARNAEVAVEQEKKMADDEKVKADADASKAHDAFLENLVNESSSKQEAMDKVTAYLPTFLNVPACYITVKKDLSEESSVLNYVSANADQSFMVGQQLAPASGEGDEENPVTRQGVSFEALKAPEMPEVEAPEDAPEDWAPPPPLGPQPMIIDNCMRNTSVKFFKIPQLGSYMALPFSYTSCDHVEGCILKEATPAEGEAAEEAKEEGEAPADGEGTASAEAPKPTWAMNKTVKIEFLIGMDTVGKARSFTESDTKSGLRIGEKLIEAFENIEKKMFETHTKFLDTHQYTEKIAELTALFPDQEAEALAAVTAELTPAPVEAEGEAAAEGEEAEAPAEVPPVSELLKASKEAIAIMKVYQSVVASEEVVAILTSMQDHVLPPTAAVSNLLYCVANILGVGANAKLGADPSWDAIRTVSLKEIAEKIGAYDAAAEASVSTDGSLASIKTFVEEKAVLPGEYPANLPLLPLLATWLTKAIAAREATLTYNTEELQVTLEKVV
jgi:hypothetical protein